MTIIPRSDAIYPPLPTVNIPPISEETDPYNLALNLSAVSDSFLKLVHAVQNHWDRDNVMTEIHDNIAVSRSNLNVYLKKKLLFIKLPPNLV